VMQTVRDRFRPLDQNSHLRDVASGVLMVMKLAGGNTGKRACPWAPRHLPHARDRSEMPGT
jgi:hypothetical protein